MTRGFAHDATVQAPDVAAPAECALFVVGSTYQTFIACGLAAGQPRSGYRHLLIHIDFEDAATLADTLCGLPAPLFDEVTVLPRSAGVPAPRWRLIVAANILRTFRLMLRRRYDKVYIFDEDRPFHQTATYWAKRRNPDVITYCAEDGCVDYAVRTGGENRRFRNRASRRLLYGWWYRNLTGRATSPWVDRHLLTHPERLRNPTHGKPVERIPSPPFKSAAMIDLAVAHLRRCNFGDRDVARLDGIVFLAKSENLSDPNAYLRVVRQLVRQAKAGNLRIAVKYHPRDPRPDPLDFDTDPEIVRLPRGLVTEFLYLHPAARLRYVIAGQTTALMTARWLRPRTTAISVASLVREYDPQVRDMFRDVGVKLVDDAADVLPLLQPHGPATATR